MAAALTSAALARCAAPAAPDLPTPLTFQQADFDELWDAALTVLRRRGFEPDRQDRVHREIRTLPETTAQWFEFWRGDRPNGFLLAESSLQTIVRTVTVRFAPASEPSGGWLVHVQVDVTRRSVPERQVTSASSALNIFSARAPTTEGQIAAGDTLTSPVPLGRDVDLERRILDGIRRSVPAAVIAEPSSTAPQDSSPASAPHTP